MVRLEKTSELPAGELGIGFVKGPGGRAQICAIDEESPLFGKLEVDDIVTHLEENGVTYANPSASYLARKLEDTEGNPFRKITVVPVSY
mmetsp:Transcript_2838/g.4229  ORF Transcript_2838/g.4229 Transcript_2838/m.4229 type:complete len:89 (+) Transcript_2838:52-318(+)|eukprot:CAMPEP_0194208480 /NCGR_PEP_ID=MMETSP0156-20130528/6918_1 /TAXON_ID=33649 /ORGANISM="Thalassionema nitzschioides, Strain L26-B" /LENGTH=88 /DNA_ID=CAMNT_0038935451 /DNA_START=35 /DNA_END=301 /DNA_ORIENTATION=-